MIWTITLIVTIKYIIFVLRALNDGEGGVFALLWSTGACRKHF